MTIMMVYISYLSILNLKGFSVALLTTYLALFGISSIWNITIPDLASRFGFIQTWMVDSFYEGRSYDMLDYSLLGRIRISVLPQTSFHLFDLLFNYDLYYL